MLMLILKYIYIFFFWRPLGILPHYFQCRRCIWNPAPGRMKYAHIFIGEAYKTPNSCGEGLLVNLFGVSPIPTGYSLRALNPLGTQTRARTINPN